MPLGDTPAKLTKDARAIIQLAFEDIGGKERLVQWANASPQNLSAFYTQIWSKIIPKEVKAKVSDPNGEPLRMVVEWEKPNAKTIDVPSSE